MVRQEKCRRHANARANAQPKWEQERKMWKPEAFMQTLASGLASACGQRESASHAYETALMCASDAMIDGRASRRLKYATVHGSSSACCQQLGSLRGGVQGKR